MSKQIVGNVMPMYIFTGNQVTIVIIAISQHSHKNTNSTSEILNVDCQITKLSGYLYKGFRLTKHKPLKNTP